jgi:hypothetical protein
VEGSGGLETTGAVGVDIADVLGLDATGCGCESGGGPVCLICARIDCHIDWGIVSMAASSHSLVMPAAHALLQKSFTDRAPSYVLPHVSKDQQRFKRGTNLNAFLEPFYECRF